MNPASVQPVEVVEPKVPPNAFHVHVLRNSRLSSALGFCINLYGLGRSLTCHSRTEGQKVKQQLAAAGADASCPKVFHLSKCPLARRH